MVVSLGSNKPTATVWRAAQEVAEPLVDSVESDGLDPLRKTLETYKGKLAYLGQLCAVTQNKKLVSVISYYHRAVQSIENLLPEFALADIPF